MMGGDMGPWVRRQARQRWRGRDACDEPGVPMRSRTRPGFERACPHVERSCLHVERPCLHVERPCQHARDAVSACPRMHSCASAGHGCMFPHPHLPPMPIESRPSPVVPYPRCAPTRRAAPTAPPRSPPSPSSPRSPPLQLLPHPPAAPRRPPANSTVTASTPTAPTGSA